VYENLVHLVITEIRSHCWLLHRPAMQNHTYFQKWCY